MGTETEIIFWDLPPAEMLCTKAGAIIKALAHEKTVRFGSAIVHEEGGGEGADEEPPRTYGSSARTLGAGSTEYKQKLEKVAASVVKFSTPQLLRFANELQTMTADPRQPTAIQDLVAAIWQAIKKQSIKSAPPSVVILRQQIQSIGSSLDTQIRDWKSKLGQSWPKHYLPYTTLYTGWTDLEMLIAVAKASANEEARQSGASLPYPDLSIPSVTGESFMKVVSAGWNAAARQSCITDGRLDFNKVLAEYQRTHAK